MHDFRLKVFHTVATRLNFTKAAEELYISQPAVTKHIKELENYFGLKLFERNGTKIKLTTAGRTLLKHSKSIFDIYRSLETEMNALRNVDAGELRLGASTTIANYILPIVIPEFRARYPDIDIKVIINNTEHIENAMLAGDIDLGVTEGYSKNPKLHYETFLKDELVLVASEKQEGILTDVIDVKTIKQLPLLVREQGSGTREVINHELLTVGIKERDLHIVMELSSSESIKNYLRNSDCYAFLSIYAILTELKHQTFKIIEVKDLSIHRNFYFIKEHGKAAKPVELFLNFVSSYNFR